MRESETASRKSEDKMKLSISTGDDDDGGENLILSVGARGLNLCARPLIGGNIVGIGISSPTFRCSESRSANTYDWFGLILCRLHVIEL